MNQKLKYVGLLAILPLMTVALSPDLIGTAAALSRTELSALIVAQNTQAEPAPEVDLSLRILGEAQMVDNGESKQTSDYLKNHPDARDDPVPTFRTIIKVSNAADSNVRNVEILVTSDTETIQTELQGNLVPKHSMVTAMIKATDPASINAKIIGFELA